MKWALLLGTIGVLYVLERADGWRSMSARGISVGVGLLIGIEAVGMVAAAVLVVTLYPGQLPGHWAWYLPVVLVVSEGLWYVIHRWSHETKPGWAIHRAHHVPEGMSMAVTFLLHPAFILAALVRFVPLLVVGVPLHAITVVALVEAVHSIWVHSWVTGPTWLSKLGVVTPLVHRWHHARKARVNYGLMLTWFDHLGGTYYCPNTEPKMGVDSEAKEWEKRIGRLVLQ